MELPDLRCVTLQKRHLNDAVQVHLEAFPLFFLSFLGPTFLMEFYNGFLDEKETIALVAEDRHGTLCGVIVGTAEPQGFFRRLLLKRWWAFARASAGAALRRPALAGRLLKALWYRGAVPEGPPRTLLSSIAVSPRCQGQGIGKILVSNWLMLARERREQGCYLTTDAVQNENVNAFYLRTGWKVQSTYVTAQGRIMKQYIYDFE